MKKVLRFPNHNLKIKIVHDESPDSPRTWDNLGTCLFFGGYRHLGDKHELSTDDFNDYNAMKKSLERTSIVVPVYLLNHSGIALKTTSFNDNWDSGQIGFISVTREKVRSEYSVKRITAAFKETIESYLEGEIETLNTYVQGEIYGFETKDTETKETDSCYGFYEDKADNGIFDNIDSELTFEEYKAAYDAVDWS